MSGMGSWHLRIWNAIMERIHSGLEYKDFEVPASVAQASICTRTGLLAVSSCPAVTEYFAVEGLPTEHCSGHVTVRPSTPSGGGSGSSDSGTTTTPSDPEQIPRQLRRIRIPAVAVLQAVIPAAAIQAAVLRRWRYCRR